MALIWASTYGLMGIRPPAAFGQVNTPTTGDGRYLSPSEAPCVPYVVRPATGTTEALVRSSGPGYLAWVVTSTGTHGDYWILRDTGSVSNTSIDRFELYYDTNTQQGNIWKFDPPMRFTNGLTVTQGRAATSITLCTRLYGTQTP